MKKNSKNKENRDYDSALVTGTVIGVFLLLPDFIREVCVLYYGKNEAMTSIYVIIAHLLLIIIAFVVTKIFHNNKYEEDNAEQEIIYIAVTHIDKVKVTNKDHKKDSKRKK